MRYALRVVLPLSLALTGVLLGLYFATDDPRFAVHRVLRSPEQHFTWTGFATYVTVMCGASLTLVTNVADICRYTRSRRDVRIGLFGSAVTSAAVTTFVGGYAAAATGESNPFVAVAGLTTVDAVLVIVLLAIVVQTLAANVTNVYTAGLSLVNAAPRLGRFRATILVAGAAIALSAFPDFVDHAQRWVTHLGNVAAPLTGVVLADQLVVRRGTFDVQALFDPDGRYRYLGGISVAAVVAVAAGVAVYYALPHAWVKVLWGVGVAGLVYLGLRAAWAAFTTREQRSYRWAG
jgi:purine-cytosine permease-like protein